MKTVLRITLLLIGLVVVGILGFVGFAAIRGIPTYDPPVVQDLAIDATPARLERGARIAHMHCIACHADSNGRLTGKHLEELPAMFGKVYSVNITQDKEVGIGNWTNGQLMHFFKTGVRKDGSFSAIMPKFPLMADEDLKSIIVWLRSGAYEVQAANREAPKSEFSLMAKLLANTVIKPLPYSPEVKMVPDSTNEIAFGRYIADDYATCYACHSADFTDQNPLQPSLSKGYYGGGNAMNDLAQKPVLTANLTFDDETGIGKKYTKEQFIKTVKTAVRPDGTILRYPMMPHSMLTDREVGAVYEYLKTVPKLKNQIVNPTTELASRP